VAQKVSSSTLNQPPKEQQLVVQQLLNVLRNKHYTLAVAESLTGGLVQNLLCEISGASDVFKGGVVAYQNSVKSQQLGVEPTLLLTNGAVDPDVAYEMAVGVRKKFDSDCAIATTGWADGDTSPGLAYIATITPLKSLVQQYVFSGQRNQVRAQVAQSAIDQLLRNIV
jgi:PncC family amidohydrolase